ncbi:hypothetical protein PVAP13_9NG423300 [Panicum virgatum]|uniref:Uncharacterized protein n=1 Tax=Panicum virgatum TaxID=38727 RepID=A0A8T0MTK7_PANVG|nr:hypothetical protein PVAP13_9NG423300 [Panicum virgatum]
MAMPAHQFGPHEFISSSQVQVQVQAAPAQHSGQRRVSSPRGRLVLLVPLCSLFLSSSSPSVSSRSYGVVAAFTAALVPRGHACHSARAHRRQHLLPPRVPPSSLSLCSVAATGCSASLP